MIEMKNVKDIVVGDTILFNDSTTGSNCHTSFLAKVKNTVQDESGLFDIHECVISDFENKALLDSNRVQFHVTFLDKKMSVEVLVNEQATFFFKNHPPVVHSVVDKDSQLYKNATTIVTNNGRVIKQFRD